MQRPWSTDHNLSSQHTPISKSLSVISVFGRNFHRANTNHDQLKNVHKPNEMFQRLHTKIFTSYTRKLMTVLSSETKGLRRCD